MNTYAPTSSNNQFKAKQRKIIELPIDEMRVLSMHAASQGMSLKKYIEHCMVDRAHSLQLEVTENPSPSQDPWFDDPQNLASLDRGMTDIKAGRVRKVSLEDIHNLLGLQP